MKVVGSEANENYEFFKDKFILDDFYNQVQACRQQNLPVAHIGTSVGRSIEYGEVKCSFTVSVECPQTKEFMDQAAELVFKKALEYTNDGMSHLAPGVPRIDVEK